MPTEVFGVASDSAVAAAENKLGAPIAQCDPQLLQQIVVMLGGAQQTAGQFNIPQYNEVAFTYVGGNTNNIATQTFKMNNVTVATLTYTYISGGVADDDLIETITQS